MVLFVNEKGVAMSMVHADEIEEGEFVDHSLTKEQISLLLILKKEDVDELERQKM